MRRTLTASACLSPSPETFSPLKDWYGKHLDCLNAQWAATSLRSFKSPDPIHGKVEIRAESESVAASITFWNSGNVTVLSLELPAHRNSVIDDRQLSIAEDIGLLLDSYFRQLSC
jgi:hypothetical protein